MTQTSKEYAAALFLLAKETGMEKEISDALAGVLQVFRDNPDYIELLAAPGIPKRERAGAVEQALTGAVPEYVVSFIQMLCERGHIRSLEACVREYERLVQESKHISTAQVVSAVPLTEEEKERLERKLQALSGHSVILECSLDESLMGGLVVQMDGRVLDGSLKHRLHEVKEVMHG